MTLEEPGSAFDSDMTANIALEQYEQLWQTYVAAHPIPARPSDPLDVNGRVEQMKMYLAGFFGSPYFFSVLYGSFVHENPGNPMPLPDFKNTVQARFVQDPFHWETILNELNLRHLHLFVSNIYGLALGAFEA